MNRGSGNDAPRPVIGTKVLILRCMFCGRRVGDQEYHSSERIYPPGKSSFGISIKCPKCKIVSSY